jgi:chemotaxis protein methyltransferase CheR
MPDLNTVPRFARVAVAEPRIRELTQTEFLRLTEMIYREAGITLPETKRALVVRRLSGRIAELGMTSFGEYHDYVRNDASGTEVVRMIDLIATNETHFFREPAHFDLLEKRVFPGWRTDADAGRRPRRVRAWSAACSTGQEPYSLAMQLLTHLPPSEGWEIELVATDISTHALRIAQAATWPVDRAREIPERYLKRFMQRGIGDWVDRMRATSELRDAVRFSRLNLNEATYAIPGEFDLIFCRNVLIYFSAEGRAAVIERLTNRLNPTGLLFVGHAESLHAHRERLTAVVPTVYRRVA